MIAGGIATDSEDAVLIGNVRLKAGVFSHVLKEHSFKNENLYYRFVSDIDHGTHAVDVGGEPVSWADFLSPLAAQSDGASLQAEIPERDAQLADFIQDDLDACGVSPLDEQNVKLLNNVHPKEWIDPAGEGKYNLVVIGADSGGLVIRGNSPFMDGH